ATWAAVTVSPGDTLWAIVERHYGEANADLVWDVVDDNPAITDPGLILPGQVITLPPRHGDAVEPTPPVVEPPAKAEVVAAPTSVAEERPTTTDPVVAESVAPATTVPVPTTVIESSAPTTAAAPPTTVTAAPAI